MILTQTRARPGHNWLTATTPTQVSPTETETSPVTWELLTEQFVQLLIGNSWDELVVFKIFRYYSSMKLPTRTIHDHIHTFISKPAEFDCGVSNVWGGEGGRTVGISGTISRCQQSPAPPSLSLSICPTLLGMLNSLNSFGEEIFNNFTFDKTVKSAQPAVIQSGVGCLLDCWTDCWLLTKACWLSSPGRVGVENRGERREEGGGRSQVTALSSKEKRDRFHLKWQNEAFYTFVLNMD